MTVNKFTNDLRLANGISNIVADLNEDIQHFYDARHEAHCEYTPAFADKYTADLACELTDSVVTAAGDLTTLLEYYEIVEAMGKEKGNE